MSYFLNTDEIVQTIRMIEQEHLDVRTITLGLSLLDCATGDIDEHNHCEVALHERLADVENVDVLLGERGGDVRGDALGVARKYGYDGFHGRSLSLSMNKSIIHGFCNFSMSALHGNCTCIFPPRMI